MLKIKEATLHIEYSPSYGTKAITEIAIQNMSLFPKLYRLDVELILEGKTIAKYTTRGLIFRNKTLTFETDMEVDTANIKLSAPLGVRVYDEKTIYPS